MCPKKGAIEKYTESCNHKNGADSRGRSKQEKSGVAPNKEKHVTENKPKQTNQTDNSFQAKQKSGYHTNPRKQLTSDTEMKMDKEKKRFLLLVKVVFRLINFFSR